VRDHENDANEKSQAADFWNDFFEIFGIRRSDVARLEYYVKKSDGNPGWIDVFWPGKFLIEHKSTGGNLDAALQQALDHVNVLKESEKPQYIAISDFKNIHLLEPGADKDKKKVHKFPLKELPDKVRLFAFIPGYEERVYKEEDEVNRKAVGVVVKLYAALDSGHYPKEWLAKLMVRLVFMFFADDAGVWDKDIFKKYLEYEVKEDGSDIGAHLGQTFETLNTPSDKRQTALSKEPQQFPYVNGGLFADPLPLPFFNKEMWRELRKASEFNWTTVSPAIFGSLFQYVMDQEPGETRHDFGAHYTSEKNIQKVISGLFLDDLEKELKEAGLDKRKLETLQDKLANIKLLDPACGCGNFLVVAYRELRRLEHEIIRRLYREELEQGRQRLTLDMLGATKVSIRQMHGIELLPEPVEIAKLALWLIDHQMNRELGDMFGKHVARLPLEGQPHIIPDNALKIDWEAVVPKNELSYILGNPPFLGHHLQTEEQKKELKNALGNLPGVGVLDYVSGWYRKAADYIQGTRVKCAFVSTNSISQGEQVGILWGDVLKDCGLHIHFAHRTFRWSNEARGRAAVFCVIVGFANFPTDKPRLFEYDDIGGNPHEISVRHINPYLVDGPDMLVRNCSHPLCDVPEMMYGSKPTDGGFFIFSDTEKEEFLKKEPGADKFVKLFIGAEDFINGYRRWCLWLVDAKPEELRALPEVMRRIDMVRNFREASVAATTRDYPHHTLFRQVTQPKNDYILVPRVSSENRAYIPMGFFPKEVIVSDTCQSVPSAPLYHFGILESEMHMSWMRAVAGRLKSDYHYSKDILYNNFPWPQNTDPTKVSAVEAAAQNVLDTRTAHPGATLADLYDPLTMPADLLSAHKTLDRAVDSAYGIVHPFPSESSRLEFLFERYKELVNK
jgi:hypothetical protein